MSKKILMVLFSLFGVLFVAGCGKHGKLHEYDDFINYVNNLQCGMNDKKLDCGLEGKYEVISNKTENITEEDIRYSHGVVGSKKRILTFEIKNTNLTFDVLSRYVCTGDIDGSCFDYTYQLSDNFHYKAFEYYLNEYNKKVDFDNKLQYYSPGMGKYFSGWFDIKKQSELTYIINYMNGFLDYANSLNFKFIDDYEKFNIEFTEYKYENGANYNLSIYFDIDENGQYTYKFRDDYYPSDEKLETYIYNYMNAEKIVFN